MRGTSVTCIPTTSARDWHSASGSPEFLADRADQTRGKPLSEEAFVQLAGWPSPMAGTPAQNGNSAAGNNDSSRQTVALAGWATPQANQANGTPERFLERKQESMLRGSQSMGVSLSDLNMQAKAYLPGPARRTASGAILTGSSAGMESGGQLNPKFSLWLMGFPPEWSECAPRVFKKAK